MDAKQYGAAIKLSTVAAMKDGLTLPEIIGTLELAKINIERMAYERAVKHAQQQSPDMKSPDIISINRLPENGL